MNKKNKIHFMNRLMISTLLFLIICSCSEKSNIDYIILSEVNNGGGYLTMLIQLNEKTTKEKLELLSNEIHDDRKGYPKLEIYYFLPDFLPLTETDVNGAWARAMFNPTLDLFFTPYSSEKVTGLTRYKNVIEMIDSSQVFKREDGTFRINSTKPLHFTVSSGFFKSEINKVIKDEVKRNIIYIAMQAFAQTDESELRITSLPVQYKTNNPNDGFAPLNYLKQDMYVNRLTAQAIIKKYLNANDFEDLYSNNSSIGNVPDANQKFKRLLFYYLDDVFDEMRSHCKCGLGYIDPA